MVLGLPEVGIEAVRARVNFWDADTAIRPEAQGETDIDLTIRWRDGTELAVLIEDKVRALFQDLQPERYVERVMTDTAKKPNVVLRYECGKVLPAEGPPLLGSDREGTVLDALQACAAATAWLGQHAAALAAGQPRGWGGVGSTAGAGWEPEEGPASAEEVE